MRLLTGPAGSGKTARVLGEFREALARNKPNLRLIVPTATLSEHLRNELARSGLVFRSSYVSTLAEFAKQLAPQISVVSPGHFHLMVEHAVTRLNRPEWEKVRDLAGIHSRLATTISDLDAAGCSPRHLARVRSDLAPFQDAIVAVWEEVERLMRLRNQVTRGAQLCTIANLLNTAKLPERIWLDGFVQLARPEIDLVCALGARVDLTLTLPTEGVASQLRLKLIERGFQEETLPGRRSAEEHFFIAETAERECEEMARRILQAAGAETPFSEMGVILRQPAKYQPLLRATFERFGIPAHSYSSELLGNHAVGRFFSGVIEALLSGWDHEQLLGLLRLIPIAGASRALDVLEIEVKEVMPGNGLETLEQRTDNRSLRRVFKQLKALNSWLTSRNTPDGWAAQFDRLSALLWPGYLEDDLAPVDVEQLRSQAAAMNAFQDTIALAAAWWESDAKPVDLITFWRVAKTLMGLNSVGLRNRSSNAVQIVSAHEARQWDFSIAFVCGLVEKEFPAQNARDPFLSDAALNDLERFGIHARTVAAKDDEEIGLFNAVRASARGHLVLSCPRLDVRGKRTLQSIFLNGREPDSLARAVRPALPAHIAQWRSPVSIRSADLLAILTEHQKLSVTNLESLLQCPFQFFARRALRVSEMPLRPEDRLSFLLQGNIVHDVLNNWFAERPELAPLFNRSFERLCDEKHVLPGYRTERLRLALLLCLERFIADRKYPTPLSSETEKKFEFQIGETLSVTGKLDRIDQLPGGRWVVVDYKFSPAAKTKGKVDDESLLQGPLYALALHRAFGKPVSAMVYVSLKDKVSYYGWGSIHELKLQPMSAEWAGQAVDRVTRAVSEFRRGVVHPRPLNSDPCRYCASRDACRVEQSSSVSGAGI